jgi:signal transduction histidine kinase
MSQDLSSLDQEIQAQKKTLREGPQLQYDQQQSRLGYRTQPSPVDGPKWIGVDLGAPYQVDAVAFVAPLVDRSPGFGFPPRFRVEGANKADYSDAQVLGAFEEDDFPNPGSFPFFLESSADNRWTFQYIRVLTNKPWQEKDMTKRMAVGDKIFALGELLVISGDCNVAARLTGDRIQVPQEEKKYSNPPLWSRENVTDEQSVLGPPIIPAPVTFPGYHSEVVKKANEPLWIQVDLGAVYPIQQVRLFPASSMDAPGQRGYGFPTNLSIQISDVPEFPSISNPAKKLAEFKREQDNTPTENVHTFPCYQAPTPFTADRFLRIAANTLAKFAPGNFAFGLAEMEAFPSYGAPERFTPGRFLRITANNLAKISPGNFAFALAEIEAISDGKNVALGKPVTASLSNSNPNWSTSQLVDGLTNQGRIVGLTEWLRGLDGRRGHERQLAELVARRETAVKAIVKNIILWASILVGTLVVGAIWLNFRSLLRKRRALEALRNRIARDIHDEVGSGLGTITLLSEMAQDGSQTEMKEDLTEIHKISKSLAQGMRDIVWFNRADVDSVRDLLMKMRETAESMLARQELHFETIGEELVRPIDMERRREIFLLYKEALHNILKHAEAKSVRIRAGIEGQNFILQIQDDGKGFDLARSTSGAGMGSMRQRVESLRGNMTFDTNQGQGTSLTLSAKLK